MHYVAHSILMGNRKIGERVAEMNNGNPRTLDQVLPNGRTRLDQRIIEAVANSIEFRAGQRIGAYDKYGFRDMHEASLNY